MRIDSRSAGCGRTRDFVRCLCCALAPFLAAADSAEFRDELAVRSPYAAHWSRPVRAGECDDKCGTAFPKTVPAEVKGGCLRAEVAPSVWGGDERLRPGWFFVTSGDGVETRWPAVPEVPHRLNLNRRQISICARVVVTLTK